MTSHHPDNGNEFGKHLAVYPERIARTTAETTRLEVEVRQIKQNLYDLNLRYQDEAAYNAGLTNDTKRKAWVAEQKQTDGEYTDAEAALAEAEAKLSRQHAEERRVLNEFAVAKLQYERGTALVNAGLPGLLYDLSSMTRLERTG